jgi:hypothetical protein
MRKFQSYSLASSAKECPPKPFGFPNRCTFTTTEGRGPMHPPSVHSPAGGFMLLLFRKVPTGSSEHRITWRAHSPRTTMTQTDDERRLPKSLHGHFEFLVLLLGDKPLRNNDPHENHRDTPWYSPMKMIDFLTVSLPECKAANTLCLVSSRIHR